MPTIESYTFGRMVIDGTAYTADLVIFPDGRIKDSWWRASGHRLVQDDIRDLVASKPDLVIAGTGASGILKADPALERTLDALGIEFRALPTGAAVKLYNEQRPGKKVGAGFHLTC